MNTRRIARLGMLAVGLGIGAAAASMPGNASADSSTDWSSLGGLALPAPSTPDLNLAISFDGYNLLEEGSASAYTGAAGNGNFDFAIAYGDGAVANAYGGTGDYALADGVNAFASAGGGSGADFDDAVDIGNNDAPASGDPSGAYAGDSDLIGDSDGGTGAYDTAIDIGNDTNDVGSGGFHGGGYGYGEGGDSGAFAGAGGLAGSTGDGDHDTAIDFGNNIGSFDGPAAVDGNYNYASESGNTIGFGEGAYAHAGNNNTVIADTDYTQDYDSGTAGYGNGNYAYVDGGLNSTATAGGSSETVLGNNDVAYVLDPGGADGSSADAGGLVTSGNNDLAAVLFEDNQAANALDSNLLYDIVSAFGNETGTAASTGGGLLSELASLF
jgi:hypothetical protein